MNDINWQFAKAVKRRRLYLDLYQKEVARTANVPLRTYQSIETGDIAPALDKAVRIAKALDTTIEELISK